MNRDSMELLLEYNYWANARVLQAVSALTADQFVKDLGNSFGSVRDTLAHILFCEEIWLMRWKGISPRDWPSPDELPDLQAFRARWNSYHLDVRNFFSKMSDESLQEVISYENSKGEEWGYPLWCMMHHVTNHSTYHRGQITTMLRQLGATPQFSLDYLDFLDEQKV